MTGPEGVPGAMLATLHVEFHLPSVFAQALLSQMECTVLVKKRSEMQSKYESPADLPPRVKFTASPIPSEARISGLSPISLKKE